MEKKTNAPNEQTYVFLSFSHELTQNQNVTIYHINLGKWK